MFTRSRSAALYVLLLSTLPVSFFACDKGSDSPAAELPTTAPPTGSQAGLGTVRVSLENLVGTQPLAFGQPYTTAHGDQFTVSKFNYFVSNIRLSKADGTGWAEPESYHLVKHSDPASRSFALLNVPPGDYTRLTFTIGVDSTRNVSGAQTGALDQLNDMFWSWSSGYIFLKLEGTSPQASNGQIIYHVGGFRRPNNTIRTVSPALPGTPAVLPVQADKTTDLGLQADVQRLFTGPNVIRFAQLSNTGHSSDPNSMRLADNYAAGLFRVDNVRVRAGN